jgi:cell division topological specificity factor
MMTSIIPLLQGTRESTVKFLIRFFGHATTADTSAPQAKERLKVALMSDRHGLEEGKMESIRDEIIRVVSKHLMINPDDVQIQIDDSVDNNKLVASFPLRSSRRAPATSAPKAHETPKTLEAPKNPRTRKKKKARR